MLCLTLTQQKIGRITGTSWLSSQASLMWAAERDYGTRGEVFNYYIRIGSRKECLVAL